MFTCLLTFSEFVHSNILALIHDLILLGRTFMEKRSIDEWKLYMEFVTHDR